MKNYFISMIIKNALYHFLDSQFAIHESSWDGAGREDLVSLSELLEQDPVGESLATDTDALEHTVTSQLLQHQGGVNLASLRWENVHI